MTAAVNRGSPAARAETKSASDHCSRSTGKAGFGATADCGNGCGGGGGAGLGAGPTVGAGFRGDPVKRTVSEVSYFPGPVGTRFDRQLQPARIANRIAAQA
jgi:hypothetical protein